MAEACTHLLLGCMGAEEHSQFKDHVEHAVGAVGLQQLYNVGVFQHVADAGFPLQIWEDRNQTMFTFNKKKIAGAQLLQKALV